MKVQAEVEVRIIVETEIDDRGDPVDNDIDACEAVAILVQQLLEDVPNVPDFQTLGVRNVKLFDENEPRCPACGEAVHTGRCSDGEDTRSWEAQITFEAKSDKEAEAILDRMIGTYCGCPSHENVNDEIAIGECKRPTWGALLKPVDMSEWGSGLALGCPQCGFERDSAPCPQCGSDSNPEVMFR